MWWRSGSPAESLLPIQSALSAVDGRGIPEWLELDKGGVQRHHSALPAKDQIALPVNEQMVVELYSQIMRWRCPPHTYGSTSFERTAHL